MESFIVKSWKSCKTLWLSFKGIDTADPMSLTEAIRRKVAVAINGPDVALGDRFRGGYGGAGLTSELDDPESLIQAWWFSD